MDINESSNNLLNTNQQPVKNDLKLRRLNAQPFPFSPQPQDNRLAGKPPGELRIVIEEKNAPSPSSPLKLKFKDYINR